MTDATAPRAFHIMAKPTGAVCNLACDYCFFLAKEQLYPGSRFRMTDEVLESYIRQLLEAHQVPEVTIAWQGGEPTLMGLDFFRRAQEYVEKYRKPNTTIESTIQTNGVLLDDEWCEFLHENNFLVGISVDGPREMHDAYRKDKAGNPVFDRVMRGLRLLQKHKVEFNILATVHAANADHGPDVYRFFRDEVGAQYLQFIPIVERDNETGFQEGSALTDRSVTPEQYGRFLVLIFDEWIKQDVGRMFVQTFDGVLASYVRGRSTLCVFSPTCGEGAALEHNGDLYSCDHFVEPRYLVGNILKTPLGELMGSEQQRAFGRNKQDTLPQYCRDCRWLFACNGECPKNRVGETLDGEPGLNHLCEGLKAFFEHTEQPMQIMAQLLQRGRPAPDIMQIMAGAEKQMEARFAKTGRNELCPCGSGRKFKHCHGRTP
ncbi:MAG: anaerobic sulfatase maturase [Armatimonadetes bacterium]|nr:anaerobic sulfatase maturase [Armatimonadota bacterium]